MTSGEDQAVPGGMRGKGPDTEERSGRVDEWTSGSGASETTGQPVAARASETAELPGASGASDGAEAASALDRSDSGVVHSSTPPLVHSGVLRLAVDKPLRQLSAQDEAILLARGRASDAAVEEAVRVIVSDVRRRGDEALRSLARRFDRVDLREIEVPAEACRAALAELDPAVRAALERAAANIAAFHRAQLPPPLEVEVEPGVRLGRRAEPLRRVAVYAPGGRAAYPSSVLMGVVPARVAGVEEVVVCSPPGPDGRPPATVLAACALAGADRVFALGGAGAIAAVAYGTATVPRVDKVVGPGNAYVTEAKQQLNGILATDCPAGPSEVLILADDSADPEILAAEVIAQAEHDPDAASVLVGTDAAVLDATRTRLAALLGEQPRRDIVEASLAARGAFLLADTLADAIAFNNRYAPEHLLVMVRHPRAALERLRHAGSIFLGASSSVAFGDYMTGANHVLPTAGLARAYPGLSTLDFLRWYTYQEVDRAAAARMSGDVQVLALAEGLPGHALCARLRAAEEPQAAARAPEEGENGRVGEWGKLRQGVPTLPHSPTPPLGSERPGLSAAQASRTAPASRTAIPLRAAYRDIDLYDPQRTPVDVDLSDNTSLFGAPPAGMAALRALADARITRYPPVYADELKRVLAERHGVAPENIVTGCGSDDVIDSAIRAFCEPGDVVAYPDPTFSMLPWFARMNAARPWPVPTEVGFDLDDHALLSAHARITYLCNPNNPTGTVLSSERVRRVTAEATGVVLIDEAYADYGPPGTSLAASAAASVGTVVLRTLSKVFGLAGLRVGYAIGPAALVREIEKSRGPYKISAAAEAVALAALAGDGEWAAANVRTVRESRARLARELEALGGRVWPSGANFVLWQAPPAGEPGRAAELARALKARGVAVRAFSGLPHAGDCLRVSVGPWPLMERFLEAARPALSGGGSAVIGEK